MAHVQTVSAEGFFVTSLSLPAMTTTTGSAIAIGEHGYDGITTHNITDNKSNTYTPHPNSPRTDGGFSELRAWSKVNAAGGSNHIVSGAWSDQNVVSLFASEFSGRATTAAEDADAAASGGTTHATPALTATANADIWMAASFWTQDPGTLTPATGYAIPTNGNQLAAFHKAVVIQRSGVTAGANTPSISSSGSTIGHQLSYSFAASGGGGGGTLTQMSFTFTGVGTVTISKKISKPLTRTATGAPTLTRKISKPLAAAAAGAASLTKKISKTLTAAATAAVSYSKSSVIGMVFSAAAHGTASLTSQAILGISFSVNAVGSTSLGKKISKSFTAAAAGTATASKKVSIRLAIAALGTANLARAISRRLVVTATAAVSFAEAFVTGVSRTFSGKGTASSTQTFIQGTGEVIYTITRTIARSISRATTRALNRLRQL